MTATSQAPTRERPAALLFDMDGVLYQGDAPVAGAAETVAWCREAGIPLLFVTNTTSRPRAALVDKLAAMGIPAAHEEILTPPVAARQWLQAQGAGPVALLVPEATAAEFEGLATVQDTCTTPVGAVVVGDLDEGWDFATLNRAFRLLMQSADVRLLALGMTRYWQAPDGLRLDTGPFVRALEYASGRRAIVLGKPAGAFFAAACDQLGVPPARCCMVGDDIRGDIEGAQNSGLRALLVRTGKFRPVDLAGKITPDAVLESVATLPAWYEALPGSR